MNKTNIANNSNLPKIIPKLSIHFEESDNEEKFPFGPITSPRPGPTFEIEVAAADNEDTKSKPFIDSSAVIIKNTNTYKYIKEIIDHINFSSTLLLSYLILKTPLG